MREFSQVNLSYNLRKDKKIISYNSKTVHYGTEMLDSVYDITSPIENLEPCSSQNQALSNIRNLLEKKIKMKVR